MDQRGQPQAGAALTVLQLRHLGIVASGGAARRHLVEHERARAHERVPCPSHPGHVVGPRRDNGERQVARDVAAFDRVERLPLGQVAHGAAQVIGAQVFGVEGRVQRPRRVARCKSQASAQSQQACALHLAGQTVGREDPQRALRGGIGRARIAVALVQVGQACERQAHLGMVRPLGFLVQRESLDERSACLADVALLEQRATPALERARDVRMLRPVHLAPQGERLCVEPPRFIKLAALRLQQGQVVQALGDGTPVRVATRSGGLQRALVERQSTLQIAREQLRVCQIVDAMRSFSVTRGQMALRQLDSALQELRAEADVTQAHFGHAPAAHTVNVGAGAVDAVTCVRDRLSILRPRVCDLALLPQSVGPATARPSQA